MGRVPLNSNRYEIRLPDQHDKNERRHPQMPPRFIASTQTYNYRAAYAAIT
jgi:hypothetical protein